MTNDKNQTIRFDWAMKRLLRNKANFSVLEGLLTTFCWTRKSSSTSYWKARATKRMNTTTAPQPLHKSPQERRIAKNSM